MSNSKQTLQAVIFDLDGTLWDSTSPAAVVWQSVANKYAAVKERVTKERLKELYGLPLEEIAVRLFQSVPKEVAIQVMEECVKAQCPYLAQHGGILLGTIEETLRTLARTYQLFIVSNCKSGYIEAFLQAHQLADYFTDHECPGGTGLLKADNIRIVMQRNQVESAVYVGDTAGDGEAAHQAGLPFIYARYGFGEAVSYEYAIERFEQLIPLLAQIKGE